MLLDDLVGVIETLKSRIRDYGKDLQANEIRTRMSLIDPLLNVLGWDTSDPSLVMPEYDLRRKSADYALLADVGKPICIIEAKKLGESLSAHQEQMVNYALMDGVPYAGLTDGDHWELYKFESGKSLEECRNLNISISGDPSSKCALQLLLLWRPNVVSGDPVPGRQPIVEVGQESSAVVIVDEGHERPEPEDNGDWVSLKDFSATSGTAAPRTVGFPNGEERRVKNWKYLYVEMAEWLVREGALTAEKCPISVGRRKGFCLIHSQPRHPNGKDFFNPNKLSNGLFLATHGSAKALVVRCKALMEHFDKDLSGVRLQVS